MSARVYTLAKELDLDNRDILDAVKQLGMVGKSSTLATLTDEEADQIRAHFRGRKVPPREKHSPAASPPSMPDIIVPHNTKCPSGYGHSIGDVAEHDESFFCSFCGTEIKRDEEKGILVDAVPIPFQSHINGCRTLVACGTCKPKFTGKKSDQFFCNMCGKRIVKIVPKTARDDTDAVVICNYENDTILVCNDKACQDKAEIGDCMLCPVCGILIHHCAGSPDGECANCQQLIHGAEVPAAPELYKGH